MNKEFVSGVVLFGSIGLAVIGGFQLNDALDDEVQGVAVANAEDVEWTNNEAREDRVCNVTEGMYSDRHYSFADINYILTIVQSEYDYPTMNNEVGETAALVIMNSCEEYGIPIRDAIERIQSEGK
jgi:hypothetical protein